MCRNPGAGSRRAVWGRKADCSMRRDALEGRGSSRCRVVAVVGRNHRDSFLLRMECSLPSTVLVRIYTSLDRPPLTLTLGCRGSLSPEAAGCGMLGPIGISSGPACEP